MSNPYDMVREFHAKFDVSNSPVPDISKHCELRLRLVFAEVHRSNMTKEGGGKRADGKILKGPNYSPPDIESVLLGEQKP